MGGAGGGGYGGPGTAKLPTLPGSAESSLELNQSFHALMNKTWKNLPYGNFVPVNLNIPLIVIQSLTGCEMKMLAALV